MIEPVSIPITLRPILRKSFALASCMLKIRPVFYPFAAIKEGEEYRCVFSEHEHFATDPSELIEILQWKLIDRVIDKPTQSLLAYAADVKVTTEEWTSAIAVDISDENGKEYFYTFSYHLVNGKVCFKGPLSVSN